MHCQKCNAEIPTGEEHEYQEKLLCEDCFIEVAKLPRACNDPRYPRQ